MVHVNVVAISCQERYGGSHDMLYGQVISFYNVRIQQNLQRGQW